MATSQVHRALPAVLVVPPAVQPAVGHSSALTPPRAKSLMKVIVQHPLPLTPSHQGKGGIFVDEITLFPPLDGGGLGWG